MKLYHVAVGKHELVLRVPESANPTEDIITPSVFSRDIGRMLKRNRLRVSR